MKLQTTKELEVTSISVKEADRKFRKIEFSNIRIMYRTATSDWLISYTKSYMETTTEQVAEIIDGVDTGNLIDQDVVRRVFMSNENETISDAQYEQVETLVLAVLPSTATTAEKLTAVLQYGIPKFIEMNGYYLGKLTSSDFIKI